MPALSHPFPMRVLVALLAWAPLTARADKPPTDDFQLSLLPRWCHLTQSNTIDREHLPLEELAKPNAYFKSGCAGILHYCWALTWSNLGYFAQPDAPSPPSFYFGQAIADYEYVLGHSGPNCIMLPDIYTKMGSLQAQMQKPREAEQLFDKALKINPRFAPTFVAMSDLYETRGDIDKARAALEAGLKANPQSSALKKKLARLNARTAGTPSPSAP